MGILWRDAQLNYIIFYPLSNLFPIVFVENLFYDGRGDILIHPPAPCLYSEYCSSRPLPHCRNTLSPQNPVQNLKKHMKPLTDNNDNPPVATKIISPPRRRRRHFLLNQLSFATIHSAAMAIAANPTRNYLPSTWH